VTVKDKENIDREIIGLINKRAALYIEDLKKDHTDGKDLNSPADRTRIYRLIEELNSGPIPNEIFNRIYNEIISGAVNAVQPISVAYLGPPGTNSHIIMIGIFGESVASFPQKTISDVFNEVEIGRTSYGVVPVENSTEGAVTYTLDELLETELKIVAEKSLRITYGLLSVCGSIRDIKKLHSHPQALAQCKEWVSKNLTDAEVIPASSTAMAAETASHDSKSGSIAPMMSAKLYGLNVLADHIEDSKQNYTRFLVIGKTCNKPSGDDKTSIVCAVKDSPGALYHMLKPFKDAGMNLTKIESRPDKKKMWEYNFFIDFNGHRDDAAVQNVLKGMKEDTLFMKILGSYPVGR
jgi:chorismate mutase / prephenate dehydratase